MNVFLMQTTKLIVQMARPSRSRMVVAAAADRPMWIPGGVAPDHLNGSLAGM